jgi:hypothetical protein
VQIEDSEERERIGVPLGNGQVCEGEMEGLVRVTSAALRGGHAHILCVADSQAALRGILSMLPRSAQLRTIQCDQLVRGALSTLPHLAILNLSCTRRR